MKHEEAERPMLDVDHVVWDFDGVLNANIVDGRLIWSDRFEADLGHSLERFRCMVFDERFRTRILTGEEDLLDHVGAWVTATGYQGDARSILDYWFHADSHPDPAMLGIMQRVRAAGRGNVIATNNEPHRTRYIERDMGFGGRVDRIFSSGRIGTAKPAAAFFQHVMNELGVPANRLILIDDNLDNVEAAAAMGWQVHRFQPGGHADLEARLKLA